MRQRISIESLESRCLLSGGVDTSFGTNGVVTGYNTILPNGVAQAVIAGTDGKLIVAAKYADTPLDSFPLPTPKEAIVRLLPDGTVDATFGDQGVVKLDASISVIGGIALQSDGKIVIASSDNYANISDVVVTRLDADGSKDTAFAGDGLVKVASGDIDNGSSSRVAIQNDGKIVVAATTGNALFVARYLPSGALDPTFADRGTGNFKQLYPGSIDAIAIAAGGKILVETDFGVFRLTASGATDPTFGRQGFAELLSIRTLSTPVGLALQSDGKIVVGAIGDVRLTQSSYETITALRLTTTGEIDKSFGNRGSFSYVFSDKLSLPKLGTSNSVPAGIAIDAKGRIILGGTDENSFETQKFDAIRVTPSGRLDRSFGSNGSTRAGSANVWPGVNNLATAVAVLPDGSVILAGSTDNSNSNVPGQPGTGLVLTRFTPAGKLDSGFGYGGRAGVVPIIPSADFAAIQPDGKVLLASGYAVARVLPNGTLDPTFGDQGMVLSTEDSFDAETNHRARSFVFVTPLTMNQSLVATSIYNDRTDKTTYSLTRYTAAGQVDPTFVVRSSVFQRIQRAAPGYQLYSAAVQSDGRIVLLGTDSSGDVPVMVLTRLTRRGQVDPTFGTGGVVIASPLQATDQGDVILNIDSQDRPIVVEQATPPDDNPSLIAIRFTRDGKADPGFGIARAPIFNGFVYDAVLRNDDTIDLLVSANNSVEVIRVTDGAVDRTFGIGGTLFLGATSGVDLSGAVFATVDQGKYVIGSYTWNGTGVETIAAFGPDGSLDTSFGINGKITLPVTMNAILPLVNPNDGSIILFDGLGPKLEKIVM